MFECFNLYCSIIKYPWLCLEILVEMSEKFYFKVF